MHKMVMKVKTFLTDTETNEFLTMFSPDDIHDIKTTADGGDIYYTIIYNFLEYIDDSDWGCGTGRNG